MTHLNEILKQYRSAKAWAKIAKKRYDKITRKEFEAWLRK